MIIIDIIVIGLAIILVIIGLSYVVYCITNSCINQCNTINKPSKADDYEKLYKELHDHTIYLRQKIDEIRNSNKKPE